MERIAPESREFLASLFIDLHEDLAHQAGTEAVAGKRAIYDALLSGLDDDERFPDDETVREYVVGLAKATDEANQYEQTMLEHRAFAELVRALGARMQLDQGQPPSIGTDSWLAFSIRLSIRPSKRCNGSISQYRQACWFTFSTATQRTCRQCPTTCADSAN